MSVDVTVEKVSTDVVVTKNVVRAGTGTIVADPSKTVVETDSYALVEKPLSTPVTFDDRTYYTGPVGPVGPDGPAGPLSPYSPEGPHGLSPALTYSGTQLTRIDYSDGDYKTLVYTGTQLTQIDWVFPTQTIRKVLTYTGTQLDSVTQTIILP